MEVGLAEQVARRYLRLADRLVPGRIVGLYVVGSAALGEHVPGRSDVDLVACSMAASTAGPWRACERCT